MFCANMNLNLCKILAKMPHEIILIYTIYIIPMKPSSPFSSHGIINISVALGHF